MLNQDDEKRKPTTFIQILDTVNTSQEIEAFVQYCEPYLSPNARIQIQRFVNRGAIIDLEEGGKGERYPCAHLQASWLITREGNALTCCMVFPFEVGDLILGNLKENTIEELYTGRRILALRRLNVEGRLYDEVTACSECDARKVVPNIWFKNRLSRFTKRIWL